MKIGMTGTRDGMTQEQKDTFSRLLLELGATELHHGDCVGADSESHDLAVEQEIDIVIHPPTNTAFRAFKELDDLALPIHYVKEIKEPFSYFTRNRHIVNDSEVLIGTPLTVSVTGGGTWYTINYGKKQGKPVYIIEPDGTVVYNQKL